MNILNELNQSQPSSLPATKNRQGGLEDSEDAFDVKIFSVDDFKTSQQSTPPIQLAVTASKRWKSSL